MQKYKQLIPIAAAFGLSAIMLRADFLNFVVWWAALFVSGLIFFPLTSKIFARFFDLGYLFSKTLGIVIPAYVLWVASSYRILTFSTLNVFLVYGIAIVVIVCVLTLTKGYKQLFSTVKIKEVYTKLLLEETVYVFAMAVWAFFRGMRPEIQGTGGLEKFMDLGFVNTILNTAYMPPDDIWFAGQSINYYYFGHYVTAFLTKLTGISSPVTYNLMMAALFSFAFVLTFSLTANITLLWNRSKMKNAIIAGLISALLITLGSNLHTVLFNTAFPVLKDAGLLSKQIVVRDNYWFPDATRFIGHNPSKPPPDEDKTIHEFPSYSFIVSDLHAHVINIPFVLTILALILAYIWKMLERIRNKENIFLIGKAPFEMLLIAFLIGVFMISNYWDFPIYLTVAVITFLYVNIMSFNFGVKAVLYTAAQGAIVLIGAYIIALPFSTRFTSITNGIGLTHSKSALFQFLIVWGYQLFIFGSFLVFIWLLEKKYFEERMKKHTKRAVKSNNETGFLKTVYNSIFNGNLSDVYALIIGFSAVGLILLPEFIYVKDIYVGGYYRSNTMFKLTYQAYIMFAVAAGYILARVLDVKTVKESFRLFKGALILAVICPLMYPFFSIPGWYGKPANMQYKGLDGVAVYFEKNLPDDYLAIKWLKENEKEQPVILEAFGDSYTDYCRVSAITGFPTVQGWGTHEWLWRNDNKGSDERRKEVTAVYESTDVKATKEIIDKYNIKYIIIGKLEREKFKQLQEEKLTGLGKVVFAAGTTEIIEVAE